MDCVPESLQFAHPIVLNATMMPVSFAVPDSSCKMDVALDSLQFVLPTVLIVIMTAAIFATKDSKFKINCAFKIP